VLLVAVAGWFIFAWHGRQPDRAGSGTRLRRIRPSRPR